MKQHYCFLERFNNYFNRKIIKYETLTDYENNSKDFHIPVDSQEAMLPFDFNPNDNVMTEIIANDVPFDPDYFLLLDDDANIIQRWFILEQKRNRQGQWLYTLRRDVIADNLENLKDAPIFVEKGMLQEDDPFILNSEGMNFNQVKRNEIKLLDRSKTSWIVGYMARNIGGSDINIQVPSEDVKIEYYNLSQIATAMGTTEGILASIINIGDDVSTKAYFSTSIGIDVIVKQNYISPYIPGEERVFGFRFTNDFSSGELSTTALKEETSLFTTNSLTYVLNFMEIFKESVIFKKILWQNQIRNILNLPYFLTDAQLEILKTYIGKYIRYNGQFYKLSLSEEGTNSHSVSNVRNDGTYTCIGETVTKTIELAQGLISLSATTNGEINKINSNEKKVIINLNFISEAATIPQLETTISSGRNVTGDQEFDIFAIPLNVNIDKNGTVFETKESYSRKIASAIGLEEAAKVYDLQLLPYCPLPDLISADNKLNITDLVLHEGYDLIKKNISDIVKEYVVKSSMTFIQGVDFWQGTFYVSMPDVPAGQTPTITELNIYTSTGTISNIGYTYSSNTLTVTFELRGADPSEASVLIDSTLYYYYPQSTNCGIVFYLNSSSFSTSISQLLEVDKSKKIVNSCYMWRLVSPNYQGAFEFNIAKNGGTVSSFAVFCTYKPFVPVIKVAPNFNWVYGREFGDNRGLICGGDFSLPRASDAWVSYQLNNKNYQNIFNREIQNLDFMQSIEMRNALVSGGVGIFSDSVKGAAAGGMASGSWVGAVVGGIVGAGASAVGYAIDIDTLARTQRETKQLAIDKFNYQLGNVKALPYTLTKVGSFDIISKIFPFIEEYSSTDEEIEALENKIKYESMTVMRIGTLREFMNFNSELNYFKGTLIRNDLVADDAHVLNAIYEELLKGVYI